MFHNLSGYDAHLFIKELGKKFNKNNIGVIAENKEKYISFNVKINVKLAGVQNGAGTEVCKINVKFAGVKNGAGTEVCKNIQLRFTDSCRFMASSLDKLASNPCNTSEIQCDKCKAIWNW